MGDAVSAGDRAFQWHRSDAEAGWELSPEGWRSVGRSLSDRRGRVQRSASRQMWEVGDWLRSGEDHVFRNLNRVKVRRLAAELTGYSRHTLTMAVSVARRVDPADRVEHLSWWHHLLVAHRPAGEQREWLARAVHEGWSVAVLRQRLAEAGVSRRPGRRPRPGHAGRLVRDLLTLSPQDVPTDLARRIRDWLAAAEGGA